jgi:hypothetical protein
MTENRDYTIAYGLHSNIPPCCIVFFLTEWEGWEDTNAAYCRAVHASPEYNYVPCPECLAFRRLNRLRICDTDCPKGYQHCREQFMSDKMSDDMRHTVALFRATMGV